MNGSVLGVDGGNTKTLALIAAGDGSVLGWGRAGCSDIYGAASPQAALTELDRAVEGALQRAGMRAGDLGASVFCLAGADWPEDFDFLRAALRGRGFCGAEVYNDALAALRAGSPDFTGVAAVCGTGANTAARSRSGAIWHSSFWQDVHGARQLGQLALLAAFHAALGIMPATSLTDRLRALYHVRALDSLLHSLTARGSTRPEIEPAARVLLEEAVRGDPVAAGIVRDHGRWLGEYALAAARQVGLQEEDLTLVMDGSVLRCSPLMRDSLAERVRLDVPSVRPVVPDLPPAAGALLLALDAAGSSAPEPVVLRVRQTLPSLGESA